MDTDAANALRGKADSAAEAPSEVKVLGVADLVCTLATEPDWDVDDLKQAVLTRHGIPKIEQRLFVGGRMLQNQEELRDVFAGGLPAEVTLTRIDPAWAKEYELLCGGSKSLADVTEELRDDRWSVLAGVMRKGRDLQYASEAIRSDREIVLEAVMNDGLAIQYAAEELKSDREIILAAVSRNGFVLELLADKFRADKEVVCAAVQKDGRALKLAAEALKDDPEVKRCVSVPGTKIGA